MHEFFTAHLPVNSSMVISWYAYIVYTRVDSGGHIDSPPSSGQGRPSCDTRVLGSSSLFGSARTDPYRASYVCRELPAHVSICLRSWPLISHPARRYVVEFRRVLFNLTHVPDRPPSDARPSSTSPSHTLARCVARSHHSRSVSRQHR